MLGIPGELVDATEHLLAMADDWRLRRVDLGVVNGRCFTFASGVGLDASVVERVDASPQLKARFGPYFFTWVAVTTFAAPLPAAPAADGGRRRRGARCRRSRRSSRTARRSPTSTTARSRSPRAPSLDSGALAGAVLHRATPLGVSLIGLRALLAASRASSATARSPACSSCRELTVRSADGRPLPLQVDGDYLGEVAEARYSILPRALNVVA